MVPISAGGLTKPTTSHNIMQSQPVAKPTTVTSAPLNLHITCKDMKQDIASGTDTVHVQSCSTDPGTALNVAKIESSDEETPLPVGTLPANITTNTDICAKETGNVEMSSSDNVPEHVETDLASKILPVETINYTQNNRHVEINSLPEETSAEPPALQPTNNDSVAATASTSVTEPATASENKGEIGAEKNEADSSSETDMDTSTHNLAKPKTPLTLPVSTSDVDKEQTDAYSDNETIPDKDIEPQIPVINDKIIETGNNTVEKSTDTSHTLEMTEGPSDVGKKGVALKLQPMSDIDINIWSNKVGHYYKFKMGLPTPNTKNNATLAGPTLGEIDQQLLSLSGHKEVDYTPMLTSARTQNLNLYGKSQKKHRPSANGPSALRQ